MSDSPKISLVVPLYNEAPNVRPLVDGVREALDGEDWEILLVDDGSRDDTVATAQSLARGDDRIRVLRLARRFGQTAALKAGFDHTRGEIVVSMDGDLQNDPRDIPSLLERLQQGADLVAGYREDRKDAAITRRFPSWLANQLLRRVTGVQIRDSGCSLRAYRSPIVRRMLLYSDLHRFLPAVAASTCGARVVEIPVRHRPRRHGTSKYGLGRVWRVLLDLLAVSVILSFRERPLRVFGLFAVLCLGVTFVFGIASAIVMLTFSSGDHLAFVFPTATILIFGLSIYLAMLGLIAEVVVRQYWLTPPSPLSLVRDIAP